MSQAGSDDSRSGGAMRKSHGAAAQASAAPAGEEQMMMEAGSGMPTWVEAGFPWAISVLLHIGVFLLVMFASYMANQSMKDDSDREPIIIPTAPSDPTADQDGVKNPGSGGDPTREAAQDKIKDVMRTDGWAQNESKQNVAGFLSGNEGDTVMVGITRGAGGSIGGAGKGGTGTGDGGPLAPYGTPGGGSGGPKSKFYGTQGNASRVVYILDHSGGMVGEMDFLKQEVRKSVESMLPVHYFAVIMVSEDAEVLSQNQQLSRATAEYKRDVLFRMDRVVAQGKNDDLLDPFAKAFKMAFAMKPQLIYFLTDGRFDDRLIDVVREFNKDKRVKINTIAFINENQLYFAQLTKLAKESGGSFKFVSSKDLGQ